MVGPLMLTERAMLPWEYYGPAFVSTTARALYLVGYYGYTSR